MSTTLQTIIVAIIIIAAVGWSIKRIFFTPSCSCGCEKECKEDSNGSKCEGCPLMNQCNKK